MSPSNPAAANNVTGSHAADVGDQRRDDLGRQRRGSETENAADEISDLDRRILEAAQRVAQLLQDPFDAGSVRVKFADGVAVSAGLDAIEQLTRKLRGGPLGKEVRRLVELCAERGAPLSGVKHGELEVNLRDGGISDLGVLQRIR